MIDEVTIASNRGAPATCKNCKKRIRGLTVRGLQETKNYNNYVCEKCLIKELDTAISRVEENKKEYERLSKMDKKERMEYLNRLKILKKL